MATGIMTNAGQKTLKERAMEAFNHFPPSAAREHAYARFILSSKFFLSYKLICAVVSEDLTWHDC